jgi:type I restriction enzyme S subunit
MAGEVWEQVPLGEVITLQRGFDLPASQRQTGEIPVVSSSGIMFTHSVAAAKAPGVVTGRYGTIGQVFYIAEDYWPLNTTLFVKDFKGNDPRFISYLLQTLDFASYSDKSSVPGVNRNHLHLAQVTRPSLPEQRAIAHILGTLDDKIELNRRMNETLENMARALFKEWFVDGAEAGWETKPVSEVFEVNPHRPLRKGDVAPYLDMANMPIHGHRAINWIARPFGSGTRFTNGDTLVARITPCLENGKTAFVDFMDDGQVGWGSTEYIVLRPKAPLPAQFGYYLARDDDFRNHVIQNMTGTSGRQRAPASCLDSYMIAVPSEPNLRKFGVYSHLWMERIRMNDDESRTLAALRDALLPKLVSGELRVKDVGKFIA